MELFIRFLLWLELKLKKMRWLIVEEIKFRKIEYQYVNGDLGAIAEWMFTLWVSKKQELFPDYKVPQKKVVDKTI